MKNLIVYILECSDKSFYVGLKNDLDRRIYDHSIGRNIESYTYSRRPVKLVWENSFASELEAIKWEKRIKGWTRKKKEALIKGNFALLHSLAVCTNETYYVNYASTPLSMTEEKEVN